MSFVCVGNPTMIPTPLCHRISGFKFRGLFLAAFCALTLATAVFAAASKKNFDLPAGDAVQTLKVFSEQSGEQIVYPVEQIRGQRTNAVRGELTAREALDAMLAQTGLVAVQDEKTGAFAVKKTAPAEGNPAPARRDGMPPVTSSQSGSLPALKDDDSVIVLSPFEVSASADDGGYAADTTLAGNRLNTAYLNLHDIRQM